MRLWHFGFAALKSLHRMRVTERPKTGRSRRLLALEPLESRQLLTISGFVYVDLNTNSAKDASDVSLQGVLLTLKSADGTFPTQTTTTGSDGSYQFTNTPSGTYSITESQPKKINDGNSTVGTLGGTTAQDVISNIVVGAGATGTDYNFFELGVTSAQMSINFFLASTPSAQDYYNGLVTSSTPTTPVVSSIAKVDTDPTNASTVHYLVTFNESVTGVNSADFTLVPGSGVTGASIASVTGSGATYTVTVNTGSGSGTLGLNLVDDDTIKDSSGTALGGTGSGNGNFVGPVYTLNKTNPAVNSIVPANANPTNATSVQYTVTFNQSVSNVDTSDFTLTATGVTGATISSVTGSGSVYTVTVNTGTGDGTLALNLVDNDTITNSVGSALGGTGTGNGNFTGTPVYTIDKTAPTVSSIVPASTNPTNAASVQFTVTFSQAVTGVDTQDFALVSGSGVTGALIGSVTGSGSVYTVTVTTGTGSGTLGLNLVDNDSIKDLANNLLGGTGVGNGNFTGTPVYTIDKTSPTVSSIVLANATPTGAASVQYTVTFSKAVTGVDTTDFALVPTGGITGATIASVTGSGTTYTVTVNTGTGSGTLGLNLVDDDSIKDALTNPLGGTGDGNGNFTGTPVYTIDKIAPTVSSIVPANATPTGATNVQYTVTFSESVTGVDTTDFVLVPTGGITGASITSVTGSGSVYTVTVNTGTGDGTLGLNLVDDDSIKDLAANSLGGTGAGNGSFTGTPVYNIDKTAPTVSSIAPANANPTTLASVTYTVTFSESVTGVDVTDFVLVRGGGVTGASITSVTGSGSIYTVTVNTGTGDGTLGLNLVDDDSIVDQVSHPLGGVGAGNGNFTGTPVYNIDKPPTVSSIVPASANSTGAASVQFTVTFSESVTGVDVTDFALVPTGTIAGASITSVTGSGSVYTVTVGTGTGNGTLGLNLVDDDSIVDAGTNPLGGTGVGNGNFTGTPVYNIDKTAPTVLSIVPANANPTNAASVQYTVTFSENVTGVDQSHFLLVPTGTVTGALISNVSGANSVYTVTVTSVTGTGTLGLNLVDDDSIVDAATNPLGGTGAGNGNFTGTPVYNIDRTAPTVTSIVPAAANPTNAASVTYTVTFSKSVTGVDVTDFALVPTGTIAGTSIASVTGSGSVYTVTVNTGTGTGTLGLNLVDDDSIVDAATNPLGGTGAANGNFTGTPVYNIDRTAPTVTSIVPAAANPANAASVTYTVTFSESVTGVDQGDFLLVSTGAVAGALISNVSGSGATYTVTVTTGTGDGTLGLNLVDDDSIVDAATNQLGGTGAGNGNFTGTPVYTIDKTPPAVTSIVPVSANPTNASSVQFTVNLNEGVTGVDATDFTLVTTGTIAGASITGVTGSGSVYTVTVNTGTGSGTLGLNLVDDDSIVDAASNPLGGAGAGNGNFTGTPVYNIDKTAPTVLSIVLADANPAIAGSVVHYTVTFSESVTGVDANKFLLIATGGVSGALISNVSGSGSVYTVTVNTGSGTGSLGLNLVDDDTIFDGVNNPLGGTGLGNGNFTGSVYTIN